MTTADMAAQAGLVRAVMQDGSVWYVRPDSVAWYESRPTAALSCTPEQLAGAQSYDRAIYGAKSVCKIPLDSSIKKAVDL